jgi:hypothetical protein
VPVREHGEVTHRERRLPPRDRIKRNTRIGDDFRAVLARNAQMVIGPLGILTTLQPPRSSGPDLVLRL